MTKRLVVYVSPWCPNCLDAQDALREWQVDYVSVDIKQDRLAASRVRAWTGFDSVPTLVIAGDDSFEPGETPTPLAPGTSPRGIDRGPMLTEPNRRQLRAWLVKHRLLEG